MTPTFPPGILLLKMYVFLSIPRHLVELTVLFLLDETHLDPLSPGCKHSGQPLRSGHGLRSEPWAGRQQQLVRCFQGKGDGHRQAVGVQWNQVLVFYMRLAFGSDLGLYLKFERTDFPE
jgi:hypothetical protein